MYWVRAGGSYSLVVALSMCPLASKRHIAVLLEAEGVWLENEATILQTQCRAIAIYTEDLVMNIIYGWSF